MADQKISAMPSAATLDGTELVPLVQGGVNVQTAVSNVGGFYTNRIALFDSTTQTALANTATVMTYDTVAFSQNISLVDNSKITFAVAGTFMLNVVLQMENQGNQIYTADFWIRLNGSDYPLSNTREDIPAFHAGEPGHIVVAINIPGIADAGDYIELVWSTTSADVNIEYTAAQVSPTRPATPSIILTVFQIG
jgi:hypothetical protein